MALIPVPKLSTVLKNSNKKVPPDKLFEDYWKKNEKQIKQEAKEKFIAGYNACLGYDYDIPI
jgi:hypothetical protein